MAEKLSGERETGVVKWFEEEKGYGFITPDSGSADIYVHFTGIRKTGTKVLKEGEKVSYKATRGMKGLQASEVEGNEESEVKSDKTALWN